MHKPDHTTTITPADSAIHAMYKGSVSPIIRRAEQLISSGDYQRAQEHLAEAWSLDPGNPYIPAIAERIALLQKMSRHESSKMVRMEGSPRYLSISVGKEFPGGIRPAETLMPEAEEALQTQIRRLTLVATNLFERGSYDPAFQSLMKAYLLDPTNPDVIACEQKLLPAWESLKGQAGEFGVQERFSRPDIPSGAAAAALRITAETESAASAHGEPPPLNALPPALQKRLEALMRRKAAERTERERALWREASGSPRSPEQIPPKGDCSQNQIPTEDPARRRSSFIAGLRRHRSSG